MMTQANKLIYINFSLIYTPLISILGCSSVSKILKKDIDELRKKSKYYNQSIITEKDIKYLPKVVQRYLNYAKVIGKKHLKSARMKWNGQIKMDEKSNWLKYKADQYNTTNIPSRIYYIKARKYLLMTMKGKDSYINGKGNMLNATIL